MFEFAHPAFVRRLASSLLLGAIASGTAAGGVIWYLSRCNFLDYLDRAAISPRQSGERYLFACGRLWQSTDGGGQWAQLETRGLPFGARDGYVAADLRPGLLYLGLTTTTRFSLTCWNCGWSQLVPVVYVSIDDGYTWRIAHKFKPGPAGEVAILGVYADPEQEVDVWAALLYGEKVIYYNSADGQNWWIICSNRQPGVTAYRCGLPERINSFNHTHE